MYSVSPSHGTDIAVDHPQHKATQHGTPLQPTRAVPLSHSGMSHPLTITLLPAMGYQLFLGYMSC